MNYWLNHKPVYRTAPATPGLLNIKLFTAAETIAWKEKKGGKIVNVCDIASMVVYKLTDENLQTKYNYFNVN